jgi:hypothetical protein
VALAGDANQGLATANGSKNPLYGVRWGTWQLTKKYTKWLVGVDAPSAYYMEADRAGNAVDKALFAKILGTPRTRWMGKWNPTYNQGSKGGIQRAMKTYIKQVTGGNDDVGVMTAVFRLDPYECEACRKTPTKKQIKQYKAWIKEFVKGVGNARMMIVLQPDILFVNCQPRGNTIFKRLIKWSAKLFSKLPRATTYIDGGSSDWVASNHIAKLLKIIGIKYVRGFALASTHFTPDADEFRYGVEVIRQLEKIGVSNKHFIVNRQMNGHGFIYGPNRQVVLKQKSCTAPTQQNCIAFGKAPYIPSDGPCDGFLWSGKFGRSVSAASYKNRLVNSPVAHTLPPQSLYLNDRAAAPDLSGGRKPRISPKKKIQKEKCR